MSLTQFLKFGLLASVLLFGNVAQSKVIHQEKSLYRNILVEDSGNLRCLKFNVKSYKSNQSCMFKSEPNRLVFNYTKLLFSGLLLQDQPQSVLIIGLGGGTMSNILHELYPDAVIDNVEIDPAVIKVARKYFQFIENDKVKSVVRDGRIFIKRAKLKNQQYDWIILDAFNGDYIPEHLLTKEFLQEAKSLLSPAGILSSNTFSNSKLYNYESATYQSVFGEFYNVKNNRNENRIILVSNQPLPDKQILKTKLTSVHDEVSRYDVNILQVFQAMSKQQDWPSDTPVLTDQFSPANLLNTQ